MSRAKEIEEIIEICGKDAVLYDEQGLEEYAIDGMRPSAACFPDTTEKVCNVMKTAERSRLAVIPRGGGSRVGMGSIAQGYGARLTFPPYSPHSPSSQGNYKVHFIALYNFPGLRGSGGNKVGR